MHKNLQPYLLAVALLVFGNIIVQGQQRRQIVLNAYKFVSASSEDSRYFAVDKYTKRFELGKFNYYNMVRVYHVRSRRYVSNLKFIGQAPTDWMRFSQDGRKLLIKAGGEYLLLDIRARRRQQKIQNTPCVGFIQGGRQLAVQEGSQIKAYDIVSKSVLKRSYTGLPVKKQLQHLFESPNQNWLVGQDNSGFYLWKKGQKELFKRIHGKRIRFTPDGRHCLVLSYRNRQCYLDIYDARSFEKERSVSSERYLPLSDFVFTDGSSISPDAGKVAFCAKRYGETKGIGIYDWRQDTFIRSIDSVALKGEDLELVEQPYRWDGEQGLLIQPKGEGFFFQCSLEQPQQPLLTLQKGIEKAGLIKLKKVKTTANGLYQVAFHSELSRSMGIASTRPDDPFMPHLVPGRYLESSPDSRHIFLQNQDSTFGYIKTADIQSEAALKVYPFSTVPYIPGQEDAILTDAAPPNGYEHLYFAEERQWNAAAGQASQFQLHQKGLSVRGDTVSWQVQLTDEEGNYYSKALLDTSIWCNLEIRRGDSVYTVPRDQWRIKEVNAQDTLPLAMAIVMDHSGSMGEERALVVQHAVGELLGSKRPQDTIALLKYDSYIGVESALCSDKDSLSQRLRRDGLGRYGGGTALLDAVDMGASMLAPVRGYQEKALVIFTDGQENSSMLTQGEVVSRALREGVKVYTIGFGASVDTAYLHRLANSTGGSYSQIYQTQDFQRIFKDVYKRLRQYYTIETELENPGRYELKLSLCLPQGQTSLSTRLRRWGSREEQYQAWLEEDEQRAVQEERQYQEDPFQKAPQAGQITLLDVYFHFDAVDLTSESMIEIGKVEQYMKRYPNISVELRGHTDSEGNDAYNQLLSQRRADHIRELLIQRGIHPSRLTAIGFGEQLPVADNDTPTGRAQNRRTEFMVLPLESVSSRKSGR